MPDVGAQTRPIVPMRCLDCGSYDTTLRLPRDTGKKDSFIQCNVCNFKEEFP